MERCILILIAVCLPVFTCVSHLNRGVLTCVLPVSYLCHTCALPSSSAHAAQSEAAVKELHEGQREKEEKKEELTMFDRHLARVVEGELRAVQSTLEMLDEYEEALGKYGLEGKGLKTYDGSVPDGVDVDDLLYDDQTTEEEEVEVIPLGGIGEF